jgi:hypothetical protein
MDPAGTTDLETAAAAQRVYSRLEEAICGRQTSAGGGRAAGQLARQMAAHRGRSRPVSDVLRRVCGDAFCGMLLLIVRWISKSVVPGKPEI